MATAHPAGSHAGVRVVMLPIGAVSGASVAAATVALLAADINDIPLADSNGVVDNCPAFSSAPATALHVDLALEPPPLLPDPSDADVFYPSRTVLRGFIGVCDAAAHGEDADAVVRACKDFVADVARLHKQHGPPMPGCEPVYRIFVFHAGEGVMDRAGDLGPWARFIPHPLDPSLAPSPTMGEGVSGEGPASPSAALVAHLRVLLYDVASRVLSALNDEVAFYAAAEEGGAAPLVATADGAGVHANFNQPVYAGHKAGCLELGLSVGAMGVVGSLMGAGLKRRIAGRLLKRKGDTALLAGSPLDAADWLERAVRALRSTGDMLYHGLACEALACAVIAKAAVAEGRTPRHPCTVPFLPEAAGLLRDAVTAFDSVASAPELAYAPEGFSQLAAASRLRLARYLCTAPPQPALEALRSTVGTAGDADGALLAWWLDRCQVRAARRSAAAADLPFSSRSADRRADDGGVEHLPWSGALWQAASPGASRLDDLPRLSQLRGGSFQSEWDAKSAEVALSKRTMAKATGAGSLWVAETWSGASAAPTAAVGGSTPATPAVGGGGGAGTGIATVASGIAASRFSAADVHELLNTATARLRDVRTPQPAIRLWALAAEAWEAAGFARKADACLHRLCHVLRALQPVPAAEHFLLPAGYTSAFLSPAPTPTTAGGPSAGAARAAPGCGCCYQVLQTPGSCMVAGSAHAETHASRVIPWPVPWMANSDIHPATSPFRFVPALSAALLPLAAIARDAATASLLVGDVGLYAGGRDATVPAAARSTAPPAPALELPSALSAAATDLWTCGELPAMRGCVQVLAGALASGLCDGSGAIALPAYSNCLLQLSLRPQGVAGSGGGKSPAAAAHGATPAHIGRAAQLLAAERTAYGRLRNRRAQALVGCAGIVIGTPLPLLRLLQHRTTLHHAMAPMDAAVSMRILQASVEEGMHGLAHFVAHRAAHSPLPSPSPAPPPLAPSAGLLDFLLADPCTAPSANWAPALFPATLQPPRSSPAGGHSESTATTTAAPPLAPTPTHPHEDAASLATAPLKFDADMTTARWPPHQLAYALAVYSCYSGGELASPGAGHLAPGLLRLLPPPASTSAAALATASPWLCVRTGPSALPRIVGVRLIAAATGDLLVRGSAVDPLGPAPGGGSIAAGSPAGGAGKASDEGAVPAAALLPPAGAPGAGTAGTAARYRAWIAASTAVMSFSAGAAGGGAGGGNGGLGGKRRWLEDGPVAAGTAADTSSVPTDPCLTTEVRWEPGATWTVQAQVTLSNGPTAAHDLTSSGSAAQPTVTAGQLQLVWAMRLDHRPASEAEVGGREATPGGSSEAAGVEWEVRCSEPVPWEVPAGVRTLVYVPVPPPPTAAPPGSGAAGASVIGWAASERWCVRPLGALLTSGVVVDWVPFSRAVGGSGGSSGDSGAASVGAKAGAGIGLGVAQTWGFVQAVGGGRRASVAGAGASGGNLLPAVSSAVGSRAPAATRGPIALPVTVYGSVWVVA